MNSFFEYYFEDTDFSKRETAVCCPFPHTINAGAEYYESNPSAHINLDKGVFHCKVCDKGLSEVSFISEILGCSYDDAAKISKIFSTSKQDKYNWPNVGLTDAIRQVTLSLGISQ